MNVADKDYLLDRLDQTHAALHTLLTGADLELQIYSDTGWRIRDILGHIATWDRVVARSLRAFLAGDEYVIPDMEGDETDFNAEAVEKQRKLSSQEIVAEWEQAREVFKVALSDIPADQFPGDLLYPWGDERGSIPRMVEYMIEHDEEHGEEFAKALKARQIE